jgi:proliferating cell nuclear antigen
MASSNSTTPEATVDLSQYVFYARTVKASPIRNLVDAIKDILTEVNIQVDAGGIKIMAMDGTHTILVHMRLFADRFDFFHCSETCYLGVDFVNLNKMVKQIKNDDSLLLFMERSNKSRLGIRIMNGERQMVTTKYLNLMELDIKPIEISPVTFPAVITMPSVDFQDIVKDLIQLGDKVEIKCAENELSFRLEGGEFGSQETICLMPKHQKEIVQGYFILKPLALFTKCTAMSSDIMIYLKNDYPIIIEYSVAGLGEIKLALAPSSRAESTAAATLSHV